MRIAEIFYSLQGEGQLVGVPSAFIRTSGCNLRCWYCDTPYTSWEPEGEELSLETMIEQVKSHSCRHVVITGGEPMLMTDLPTLTGMLREQGLHITIETAGTVFQPVKVDLMSISPKLGNSTPWERDGKLALKHEQRRHAPKVIRQLIEAGEYQIKLVIDQPEDVAEAERWLAEFPEIERGRVFLMPQAVDRATLHEKSVWLGRECQRLGFRLGCRLHIDLFGHQRGT